MRCRPTVAATSGLGSSPAAYCSMVPPRPGEALRMPTAVTSLRAMTRVSTRLGCAGQPDEHQPASGLHEVECRPGDARVVGGVDDRVPGQRGQGVRCPGAMSAQGAGQGEIPGREAGHVYLRPGGEGELGAEQAYRARPEDEHPAPRAEPRCLHGAQGVAARLHHRAGGVIDAVRQRPQRGDRHEHLLREGARPSTTDADLVAPCADVLAAVDAAVTGAAAQHGVAGHPPAEPGRPGAVAGRGDHAAPLVAGPQRV